MRVIREKTLANPKTIPACKEGVLCSAMIRLHIAVERKSSATDMKLDLAKEEPRSVMYAHCHIGI